MRHTAVEYAISGTAKTAPWIILDYKKRAAE